MGEGKTGLFDLVFLFSRNSAEIAHLLHAISAEKAQREKVAVIDKFFGVTLWADKSEGNIFVPEIA